MPIKKNKNRKNINSEKNKASIPTKESASLKPKLQITRTNKVLKEGSPVTSLGTARKKKRPK